MSRWRDRPAWPLYLSSLFFALMGLCVKLLTGSDTPVQGWAWSLVGSHHDLDPVPISFFRSLVPGIALLPLVWRELPSARGHIPWLVLRGVAGGSAMVLYFVAIDRTDLSSAVLLNYTSPLWAALMAAVVLKERVPRSLFWAFPLSFAGVYLLVGGGTAPLTPARMWGYVAGLASAVMSGLAYTSVRQLGARVSPQMVVFWFSLVTCVIVLPWMPGTYAEPTPLEWVLLLLAGIFAGFAQQFMTIGFQLNRAARASTLNLVTIGFTTILAVGLLGETFTLRDGIGMLLLLIGILAASSPVAEEA